jgi:DNA-binding SARP family transcriptional activator
MREENMNTLYLSFFGDIRVVQNHQQSDMTHTTQALLAYLVLQRHRKHPRKLLAGMLWGDTSEERAQAALRTALWRLRQVLEPEGTARGTYLTGQARDVGFNRASKYWLDIEIFENQIAALLNCPVSAMYADDALLLEETLALYTADLLEGFYEDWVISERERLYHLYLNGLQHLMLYYRQNNQHEKSLECGRKILQYDPLQEAVHREMMALYAEIGQRALAIRQYEICRTSLTSELHIQPMDETQALYAHLLADENAPQDSSNLGDALLQLDHAISQLDKAQAQLQWAIRNVERLRSLQLQG